MSRRWRIAALTLLAACVALGAAVWYVAPLSSGAARRELAAALSSRLDSEVEIKALTWRVFPSPSAEGDSVTLRHRGRHDVPPLISIAHFTAAGTVFGLLRGHISRVTIDGLDIEIPPNRHGDEAGGATPAPAGGATTSAPESAGRDHVVRTLVVDELVSTDARLTIIPEDPRRDPKVWRIHALRMRSVAFDHAMPFDATLTNALPPGEIATRGTFGPWRGDAPGLTNVDGAFSFAHADLSAFKGMAGLLSSRGTFAGTIARLDIHGVTDTPDFALSSSGRPVPLHTEYHAVVDGTNGDTILTRVDASLPRTTIVATGRVVGTPGVHGRIVSVAAKIDKGRLEDVLALAVKSATPPMTGSIQLDTSLVLPRGDEDVVKKLRLHGHFAVADARFNKLDVQARIDELSRRALGRPGTTSGQRVAARFSGAFALGRGSLALSDLAFAVPGSVVRLAGRYDLLSQDLDFTGTLLMNASVSETTTGLKRFLLKLVDPLFSRRGGGSAIPIRITGTRTNPSFGLDKGRIFRRGRDAP